MILKKLFHFSLFILIPVISFSQSGTLKTKTGVLLYFNDKPICFTVRLDEPNSEMPYWEEFNRVRLFKDVMYLTIAEDKSISCETGTPIQKLICYQKWETDFINKTMKKSIERSGFLNDNATLNLSKKNCVTNAWYNFVKINAEDKFYFYFLDIYSNNGLIRITYTGSLENARLFIKAVYSGMRFFNKEIDIKQFQNKLRSDDNDY